MTTTVPDRARIAVVTTHWSAPGEEAEVVRLLAGALSRHGEVAVVHLDAARDETVRTLESVFTVHHTPLVGSRPLERSVLKVALAQGGARSATGLLESDLGWSRDAPRLIEEIAPDVTVLAGHVQPFDHDVLARRGAGSRLVFLPLTDDDTEIDRPQVSRLLALADAVGTVHPGEQRVFEARLGARSARVMPLEVALTINRSATEQGLFGVAWFGPYVVLIRRFPADGPRYARGVTHELLQRVLGRVAIAEVDGRRWRVSDALNTAELPVNPTRVNLWRLMANAVFTVDQRPPSCFGRESLESMLLGSPVVAPDPSAAMEHVAAANGGLWFRDAGELLDMSRTLLDDASLRCRLAASALAYATTHHGDMATFVARARSLALGGSPAAA